MGLSVGPDSEPGWVGDYGMPLPLKCDMPSFLAWKEKGLKVSR